MTEQEKNEILDEIEKRMDKKYKGCLSKEDTQSILSSPRNKWFRDDNGNGRSSLMANAFDSPVISWQVWEAIRKLTCVVCGKQYVRHLSEVDNADYIAEKICQFIYDLKMEVKEKNKMEFKSNAKYREPVGYGSIFALKDNRLGIEIHKIHHCGDKWYLSCRALCIYQMSLDTEDFHSAVNRAKKIILKKANDIVQDANKFYLDEEVKVVRY